MTSNTVLPHCELYDYIKKNGVPDSWSDTLKTQAAYGLEEKGWLVDVSFRKNEYGAGTYAEQDISNGTPVRKGVFGKNMIALTEDDLKRFSDSETTLTYCGHYAFGTYGNNPEELKKLQDKVGNAVHLWIPGSVANHNNNNNIKFVNLGDDADVYFVACRDIKKGEEIFHDYNEFEEGPEWFQNFVKKHGMHAPFRGLNDYVFKH